MPDIDQASTTWAHYRDSSLHLLSSSYTGKLQASSLPALAQRWHQHPKLQNTFSVAPTVLSVCVYVCACVFVRRHSTPCSRQQLLPSSNLLRLMSVSKFKGWTRSMWGVCVVYTVWLYIPLPWKYIYAHSHTHKHTRIHTNRHKNKQDTTKEIHLVFDSVMKRFQHPDNKPECSQRQRVSHGHSDWLTERKEKIKGLVPLSHRSLFYACVLAVMNVLTYEKNIVSSSDSLQLPELRSQLKWFLGGVR